MLFVRYFSPCPPCNRRLYKHLCRLPLVITTCGGISSTNRVTHLTPFRCLQITKRIYSRCRVNCLYFRRNSVSFERFTVIGFPNNIRQIGALRLFHFHCDCFQSVVMMVWNFMIRTFSKQWYKVNKRFLKRTKMSS